MNSIIEQAKTEILAAMQRREIPSAASGWWELHQYADANEIILRNTSIALFCGHDGTPEGEADMLSSWRQAWDALDSWLRQRPEAKLRAAVIAAARRSRNSSVYMALLDGLEALAWFRGLRQEWDSELESLLRQAADSDAADPILIKRIASLARKMRLAAFSSIPTGKENWLRRNLMKWGWERLQEVSQ